LGRKVWLAALTWAIIFSLALVAEMPLSVLGLKKNGVTAGSYYYIIFGIPNNNHWTHDDIKGTPFSYYNSSDPKVAELHISEATQHNINLFAVFWEGQGTWLSESDFDYIDRENLQNAFLPAAANSENFTWCIHYETKIVFDTSNNRTSNFSKIFIDDLTYAAQNYFNTSKYWLVDGRPAVFIYNLPFLYQNLNQSGGRSLIDAARQKLLNMGVDVYFIGDVGPLTGDLDSEDLEYFYSMDAVTSYFFSNSTDWSQVAGWSQVLKDAEQFFALWKSVADSKGVKFIPNVFPGFNNTGNPSVADPTVLPRNETAFGELLRIAMKYTDEDLQLVMITSFNEWMEATNIEQSVEENEAFLDIVLNETAAFNQPSPSPEPNPRLYWTGLIMVITLVAVIVSAASILYFWRRRKRHERHHSAGAFSN
jgi:Glycosyl hydrolase family 99